MTSTNLAHNMNGIIALAPATAVWNIANVLLNICEYTHEKANLHLLKNFVNDVEFVYATVDG